ncbi:MAG: transcription antitermination factor NusB [bacterium]
MVNRVLLRVKVLQILYSFFIKQSSDLAVAEKELQFGAKKSYDLYHSLLLLIVEVKRYSESRIELIKSRESITGGNYTPNMRFVNNKFIEYLENSEEFNSYISNSSLSWADHTDVVKKIYDSMVESDYFNNYMNSDENSVTDDKSLIRKIIRTELTNNEDLYTTLEDISIYWIDDVDIILSFVEKSVKNFDKPEGEGDVLLPMYKDESDYTFANNLLNNTIVKSAEFDELLRPYMVNWELERMAVMDILILKMALTEILDFDTIPANVTLNVYIDLAKAYNSPKSGKFVNGVLDKIVKDLRKENKILK